MSPEEVKDIALYTVIAVLGAVIILSFFFRKLIRRYCCATTDKVSDVRSFASSPETLNGSYITI